MHDYKIALQEFGCTASKPSGNSESKLHNSTKTSPNPVGTSYEKLHCYPQISLGYAHRRHALDCLRYLFFEGFGKISRASVTPLFPTYRPGTFTFAAPQQMIRPPIPASPGVTLLDQDQEPEVKVDLYGTFTSLPS